MNSQKRPARHFPSMTASTAEGTTRRPTSKSATHKLHRNRLFMELFLLILMTDSAKIARVFPMMVQMATTIKYEMTITNNSLGQSFIGR